MQTRERTREKVQGQNKKTRSRVKQLSICVSAAALVFFAPLQSSVVWASSSLSLGTESNPAKDDEVAGNSDTAVRTDVSKQKGLLETLEFVLKGSTAQDDSADHKGKDTETDFSKFGVESVSEAENPDKGTEDAKEAAEQESSTQPEVRKNYIYTESEQDGRAKIIVENPVNAAGEQPVYVRFETKVNGEEENWETEAVRAGGNTWYTEVIADKNFPSGTYRTSAYAVYTNHETGNAGVPEKADDEESANAGSSDGMNTDADATSEGAKIGDVSYQLSALQKNETSVPQVMQNPELPTGCESVALTIDLMSLGFSLEKTTIADEFLPYGDNFAVAYVGNPHSGSGAGCFPPCIVQTANKYLHTQNSRYVATDVSGRPLQDLFSYIDEGKPVILWHTMYMAEPRFTGNTATWAGKTYQWYRSEHCLVLYGYDLERNVVKISDPLAGLVERDLDAFSDIFDETGQYAVVIR